MSMDGVCLSSETLNRSKCISLILCSLQAASIAKCSSMASGGEDILKDYQIYSRFCVPGLNLLSHWLMQQ